MLTEPEEDYARGFVPFLAVNVRLDSRPLIPRVETEFWVERAIAEMPAGKEIRVLDLCAGSGAIGLSVMKHRPRAHVTFAEIEPRHLETIRESITTNELDPERASVVQSDVWSGVAGPFEYILANPPYISRERGTVSASVLEHEPHEALFAKDDGYFFIEQTIEGLPRFMQLGGVAWIEHEPYQTPRLEEDAARYKLSAQTLLDQYGMQRVTRLTRA